MCRLQLRLRTSDCLPFLLSAVMWMEWSRHAEFSEVISYSMLTSLQHCRRLTDALMSYWYASSFLEAQHFVNHLIQAYSNYAQGASAQDLGVFIPNLGKSLGKLRQLVTQPPAEQWAMSQGSLVPSPNFGPHQQHSFSTFIFFCIGFVYTFCVRKRVLWLKRGWKTLFQPSFSWRPL